MLREDTRYNTDILMSTLSFGLGVMDCDIGADMINGLQYIKKCSIYKVHESHSDNTQGCAKNDACIFCAVFALINQPLVHNLCLKIYETFSLTCQWGQLSSLQANKKSWPCAVNSQLNGVIISNKCHKSQRARCSDESWLQFRSNWAVIDFCFTCFVHVGA